MIFILCIFALFFSSCEQKPQVRHYTEIIVEAPQVNTPSLPDASVPVDTHVGSNMFTWVVPQGWKEEAAGGMRLATFHLIADPNAFDCDIVALAGPAGGLEANLERWLGQLGISASDDHLHALTDSVQILRTKDGLEIKVFDFTALQTKASFR